MDLLQSALKYGHTSSQFMAANGETLQQQTQRQNFDSSVVYYIQIQDIPFLWFFTFALWFHLYQACMSSLPQPTRLP